MQHLTKQQLADLSRRNNAEAVLRRKRNLDIMRDCCDHNTAEKWSRVLRVSEATVRDYARALGEKCKPKVRRARARPSRPESVPPKSGSTLLDRESASMMVRWASKPITGAS